jgi:hypothetical protein
MGGKRVFIKVPTRARLVVEIAVAFGRTTSFHASSKFQAMPPGNYRVNIPRVAALFQIQRAKQ